MRKKNRTIEKRSHTIVKSVEPAENLKEYPPWLDECLMVTEHKPEVEDVIISPDKVPEVHKDDLVDDLVGMEICGEPQTDNGEAIGKDKESGRSGSKQHSEYVFYHQNRMGYHLSTTQIQTKALQRR
jgi:hypothetical protein